MRADYPKYFEVLQKHPRMLVGMEVPSIGKDGTEVLRDSTDAAEWKEAVQEQLVAEIKDRAIRLAESGGGELTTVHAAIELFQNNIDLVPGTQQFDRALADRFVTLAEPYKAMSDGKFVGYSIPVQPLVNQIRAQLVAERAIAPAAAPAPAAAAAPVVPVVAVDAPQAGIQSKAGGSGEDASDFSALFGTIGLPGLRI